MVCYMAGENVRKPLDRKLTYTRTSRGSRGREGGERKDDEDERQGVGVGVVWCGTDGSLYFSVEVTLE